jgi:hypothetical protein
MKSSDIDAGDTTVPYPLPDELVKYYSIDNAAPIVYEKRYESVYVGGDAMTNIWTKLMIEEMLQPLKERVFSKTSGTYGPRGVEYLYNRLSEMNLAGKRVLVIGSEKPWVESICLSLGAAHVTTLEYGKIVSEHPQIDTITPDRMRELYLAETLGLFDAVVTHSSVEHSGLGRYGDALNPWGDLLTIARAWCVSKPDAEMYVGVPRGKDRIVFNGHRFYGKVRFSLLATNWVQVDGDKHFDKDFEVPGGFPNGGIGLLFKKVESFHNYLNRN